MAPLTPGDGQWDERQTRNRNTRPRYALAVRARRMGLVLLVILASPLGVARGSGDWPATAGFFDLAVPGGRPTLDALRIPEDDRALTLSLIARSLNGQGNSAEGAALARAVLAQARLPVVDGSPARPDEVSVPAPISEAFWRELLQLPAKADMFSAIGERRAALLLTSGATAADLSIRTFLDDNRDLARWILQNAPGAFAVVGRSLQMAGGRIVTPGGPAADPVWEAVVGVAPSRPAPFIRNLLSRDEGRLAWFFESVVSLGPERQAWLLGDLSAPDAAARARDVAAAFRETDPSWNLERHPFQRSAADLSSVLRLIDLDGGRITGPSWQSFWQEILSRNSLSLRDAETFELTDRAAVTAPWLMRRLGQSAPRERRSRFEALRLAQRVFPHPEPDVAPDLLVAISAYRRFPALLLTLERIGVARPSTWAAIVEAARKADRGGGRERRTSLAVFQGAIALIERACLAHTLDAGNATALIDALAASFTDSRTVPAGVAEWITQSLIPALPPLEVPDAWTGATAHESTILQAMSGLPGRDAVTVTWEGLAHTVDLAATERERLHRLRALVPSPGLDAALESKRPDELAAAITALVYTPALGDADGDVALSPDVALRHDFGETSVSGDRREMGPWTPPRDMLGIDGPWRVEGALMGLDLALARLAVRRLVTDEMPRAPTINLNDWQALVRGVALADPRELTDADRDALAAALVRGRERVVRAVGSPTAMASLAREAHLSDSVRQLLPWMAARQPDRLGSIFGLRDLLWLGEPALTPARLDRWGVAADPLDGRRMPAMPRSSPWDDHAGHADDGRMATQVPDVTLRLVEETARLGLPARLVPALLAFAVQDFAHDVDARFADDWPAMVRAARALPSTRVEDYVAALTGTGHLR